MTDVQVAALYDAQNTWAADDDFFLGLLNRQPNSRVLDLGCGTGRVSLAAAAAGHDVMGIDPHFPSLTAARRKPGAGSVTWLDGTSAQIPEGATFDVAIMTAHVAQAISDDADWRRTLDDLYDALAPGGLLVFDSRDPAAKAWERWTPAETRTLHSLSDGSMVETWIECASVAEELVEIIEHRVLDGVARCPQTSILAFRGEQKLRSDLSEAGFIVENVVGGWAWEEVGRGPGELIVVARVPL